MVSKKDYYEVLGVGKAASKDKIKDAYRKMALQYHPDRNKSPGAEERFKEISEAYAVLSDDAKRREYDSLGHAGFDQRHTREDIFREADFESVFKDMGFNFGDVFGRFFSRGDVERRDLAYEVNITREEVVRGAEKQAQFTRTERCAVCGGTGARPGTAPRPCPRCGGRGQVQNVQRDEQSTYVQIAGCPTCGGRGHIIDFPCGTCRGTGLVRRRRTLTFRVPAGVHDGFQLRFKREGDASLEAETPGDLCLLIRVTPYHYR
jgi:molecular chaperone DnaJ